MVFSAVAQMKTEKLCNSLTNYRLPRSVNEDKKIDEQEEEDENAIKTIAAEQSLQSKGNTS